MTNINTKYLAIISVGIVLSFIIGIYAGHVLDSETKFETLTYLIQFINDVTKDKEGTELTFIIFKNNLEVALTLILLGVTIVLPFAVIFANGLSIGVLNFATQRIFDIFMVEDNFFTIKATIVHGIPELFAIFLGAAIGVYLGIILFTFVISYINIRFNNNPYKSIRQRMKFESNFKFLKENIIMILKIIVFIIIPLLIIAAILEVYVTPIVMDGGAKTHNDISFLINSNSTLKSIIDENNCTIDSNNTKNYIDQNKVLPYVVKDDYYTFLRILFSENHNNKNYYLEYINLINNSKNKGLINNIYYFTMQYDITKLNKYYNITPKFDLNNLNIIMNTTQNISIPEKYIVNTNFNMCIIMSDVKIQCPNKDVYVLSAVCE